jgi:hypothetical protein
MQVLIIFCGESGDIRIIVQERAAACERPCPAA